MTDFVELVFGCQSWQQAHDISDHLLSKQLIARAEVMTAKEIKLLVTTADEHIESIEAEIKELLQLEEITLHKIPLARFNHYTISGTGKNIQEK
jgi:uncharacterized protein involved in tolerance to divalent cations